MAIEKIIDIKVQGNAEEAVGSLRSQLRQAQAEVAALSDKFGVTSEQAIEAAKRAAQLKDQIGDAKNLTDAFNPDAKFKALSSSLSGVAGGFAAVQGGMALLGTQSADVEATLLKVQSAMALSQGLQAIGEAQDSFKQLGAVANDVFKSIKGAIGSTGIGLFVIAIAGLVTYWDEISNAVSGATEETKAYEEANKGVSASIAKTQESLISVKISIDSAKKGIISKSEALKNYNEKLGEAFGRTDDLSVAEQRMAANTDKYIKAQIARATAQAFVAKSAEAAAKAASGEALDLSFWDKAKIQLLGYGELGRTIANKTIDNQKEIAKFQKLAVSETEKAERLTNEINANSINKRYDANKKAQADALKDRETTDEKLQRLRDENFKKLKEIDDSQIVSDLENIDATNQAKRDKDAKFKQDTLDAQKQYELDVAQLTYDSETEREARAEEARQRKIKSFQETTGAIGSIAKSGEDLLASLQANGIAKSKAGQAVMKSLALVQIATDSAIAFSKMMQGTESSAAGAASVAGPAAPAVYLATKIGFYASGTATILSNIARARALLSGEGNEGGGASVSSPSGGGASMTAPSFNTVGSSSTNQLAQTIGQQSQTPVRSYVVASDVSTAQALDRNIISNATIGR